MRTPVSATNAKVVEGAVVVLLVAVVTVREVAVGDTVVVMLVVVEVTLVVVEETVLVLEGVVVATHLSNVLSWYRSIASFKYATARHASLKSLIRPDPLHPKTFPDTTPSVNLDTIVFNSADASRHVPEAACKM